jgi:5-methylcytosine-specific restriction endonuclease McrA
MNDVLDTSVLILNRLYQPVRVTTVRNGFRLLFRGVAQVVDDSGELLDLSMWARSGARDGDNLVRTASSEIRVPRVLRLLRYDGVHGAVVHLSRRNVMVRDRFQCQYCGATPGPEQLNIDHVVPRSQGGRDCWENLVTACRSCNLRKGGRTPDQSNMRLRRRPAAPAWSVVYRVLANDQGTIKAWEPFLQAV